MSTNKLDQLYRSVIMEHYKHPKNKGILDDGNVTIDMNNPTCGDVIHLTMNVENDIVKDAKFEGEGCSISMASASMMTQMIKNKTTEEAVKLAHTFSDMMLGKDLDESVDLDDLEALSGVAQFPARIKCATLSWKAMEKGVSGESQ
ncbi:SUF system NifU family Fe-S cluster assembly protein [Sporosarcina sp. P37]|uniref:Fe-S cluster assembly sulfur transfer protein SufU n=1 Tax=unclassified Sporosarcina TaxID=2647733 RepID=UPI0009BEC7A2|nr:MULTISPECIES: SUF system NifU family Fe-S cluster assembly protein [unclassified Sporosarcina]ARD47458.1 iron-sulfur cluster assembly scaffold protein NifU [Sporosarcina sp. P33]ARK24028.1 SUF system NifU family Fe-S cluster assembly protein [Sporosarcina sp. P37]PID18582.1 SUF system NifU family Fe-S cluster assembly protein [Sporosarcina sp. P35]